MIKIGKSASNISVYSCQPKHRKELEGIILDRISKEGPNCDLNDIDTSEITDMYGLFYGLDFNGDISNWNVSNVKDMNSMFFKSKFNQDISRWNVSKVRDIQWMFTESEFNKDISNWKINEDCLTWNVFYKCPIKKEFKPESIRNR